MAAGVELEATASKVSARQVRGGGRKQTRTDQNV